MLWLLEISTCLLYVQTVYDSALGRTMYYPQFYTKSHVFKNLCNLCLKIPYFFSTCPGDFILINAKIIKLELYSAKSIRHIRSVKRTCTRMSVTRTVWDPAHLSHLANLVGVIAGVSQGPNKYFFSLQILKKN